MIECDIDENEDDIDIIGDNLNDETIRILADNINIKWCPQCNVKVVRTDYDIQTSCSVMKCIEDGCGDDTEFTYWCWDCSFVIPPKEVHIDPVTNEPGGACRQCRKISRSKRNRCKPK